MQTGISTGCLYPMPTEDSIRTLTDLGFHSFEIFFNSFSELEPDYLDRIRFFLNSHGASVISLHPFTSSFESFLLFSAYERRFLDGVSFYEMYFRAAKRLNAKMVVLHGLNTSYGSALSDNEYFRRFAILQERAKSYGITLLQENVCNFRSRDPAFIQNMILEIPESAAFVLDIKQALRSGTEPLEMAKIMGNHLYHIHISDNSSENRCVLPGKGCYSFRPLLQYLKDSGYEGHLITEVYRFSFDALNELAESQRWMENKIVSVNNGRGNVR